MTTDDLDVLDVSPALGKSFLKGNLAESPSKSRPYEGNSRTMAYTHNRSVGLFLKLLRNITEKSTIQCRSIE